MDLEALDGLRQPSFDKRRHLVQQKIVLVRPRLAARPAAFDRMISHHLNCVPQVVFRSARNTTLEPPLSKSAPGISERGHRKTRAGPGSPPSLRTRLPDPGLHPQRQPAPEIMYDQALGALTAQLCVESWPELNPQSSKAD
eukprot:2628635-Rhodomonas_salina.2